ECKGRNDRVDAASIRKARVHHRTDFVDAPADQRDNAIDDLPQVQVVAEANVGPLQPAFALGVNAVVAIDQNIGDGRVFQQGLKRSKADSLIHHVVHQLFLLDAGEQDLSVVA